MKTFTEPLEGLHEFALIRKDLESGQTPVRVSGCIDVQKSHLISALGEAYPRKLIITYSETKARQILADYRFFDSRAVYYPAKDLIFYSADVQSDFIVGQRMTCINRILSGEPVTVVTVIDSLMDKIQKPEQMRRQQLHFTVDEEINLEETEKRLADAGFERVSEVETPGQFAVRGGILDIFNVADENPVRIELWDDTIDSIRIFDAQTQRSINDDLEEFSVYPAAEYFMDEARRQAGIAAISADAKKQAAALSGEGSQQAAHHLQGMVQELTDTMDAQGNGANIDSYAAYFYDDLGTFLDYFDGDGSLIAVDEPARVSERGDAVYKEYSASMEERLGAGAALPGQARAVSSFEEVLSDIADRRTVLLTALQYKIAGIPVRADYGMHVVGMSNYNGNFEMLMKDIDRWMRQQYRLVVICSSELRGTRLASEITERGYTAMYTEDRSRVLEPRQIMVTRGALRQGIEYPDIRFAIISETDIVGAARKKKRSRRKDSRGEAISSLSTLSVGDYVVHERWGIGVYQGIEKIETDDTQRDYIRIAYKNEESLLIPVSQLDAIQKYADKGAEKVAVNSMGGREWKKTRRRVSKAVHVLAADLVRLYAIREHEKGYACGPDTVWQKEFEDMFPYEETNDQIAAIDDVKRDMESTKIMDRLICGDVGFGKTEVAIRAAFKMVQEGKQVAMLVPTTILAQQHYQTFSQRMKDYPVNIEMLSRFRTSAQQKETIRRLKSGETDIVIGTHRLLSADVGFKDLGLLIVDEEQRFGVTHKEKIKNLRKTVDVLTLTATPIPRTMHMSLIGIRDISLLNEAPMDRLPIQTYIMEYDEGMVRRAIIREMDRGGQVFYVYNRVRGIEEEAAKVSRLVPEAEVAYAHGQMRPAQLEKILSDFVSGDIDVLVSTTIIETGMDMPNVNTIIIQDADRFGLAQLYQLRGRVGRSSRTSYAFLLYKRDKVLREVAEKRLAAIREFTDLGSGYRIAMRDLEIRGAGSLLGGEQSGHMEAVGYDLYCKMLGRAIREEQGGEAPEEDFDTSVDIKVDAYIPDSYIRNEMQKLEMYKRIARIGNEEEKSELVDELVDRFGDVPQPVDNLLSIALLKAMAHSVYVTQIVHRGEKTTIYMYERAKITAAAIPDLLEEYGRKLEFKPDPKQPRFIFRPEAKKDAVLLKQELKLVSDMSQRLTEKPGT